MMASYRWYDSYYTKQFHRKFRNFSESYVKDVTPRGCCVVWYSQGLFYWYSQRRTTSRRDTAVTVLRTLGGCYD